MANRYFEQFRFSLEKMVVELWGKVTIGSTGAPTLVAASSQGIASIARTDTGDYTITLSDTYNKFLDANFNVLLASGSTVVAQVQLVSETVGSTKTLLITCLDFAGSPVDPDNGAVLYFRIALKNSSV